MKKKFAALLAFIALSFSASLSTGTTTQQILNMVKESDSVLVADHAGNILLAKNDTIKQIPASTLKILTMLSAFHFLGKDHRFTTEFYTDDKGNLKIKGYGDPLLISEVLQEIAPLLAKKITRCNNIIVDNSYFSKEITTPGASCSTNPYDAPLSALSVNFNTVFFKRDKNGRILSAEPQTPIIPYAIKRIKKTSADDRLSIFEDSNQASLYAGHLILHFLKKSGIACSGVVKTGHVLPEDKPLYTHTSRFDLRDVAKSLFRFSNNFIANQVILALGAKVYGAPGTLNKGARAIRDYAEKTLGLTGIRIVEGSGISRQNRLSARDMFIILKKFKERRKLLAKKNDVYYKTGTLHGIRTRAGYIEKKGGPFYFVLFLKTTDNNIDRLMNLIVSACKKPAAFSGSEF